MMNILTIRHKRGPADIETRIPLIEERLNVSKRTPTSEATITKEPVTVTRTVSDTVRSEKIDTSGSKEE